MPTNESRANRAHAALVAYLGGRELHRIGEDSDGDSWDEAIRDLITDLGHLYYREITDFQTDPVDWTYEVALGRAHDAFMAEQFPDEDPQSLEALGVPGYGDNEESLPADQDAYEAAIEQQES